MASSCGKLRETLSYHEDIQDALSVIRIAKVSDARLEPCSAPAADVCGIFTAHIYMRSSDYAVHREQTSRLNTKCDFVSLADSSYEPTSESNTKPATIFARCFHNLLHSCRPVAHATVRCPSMNRSSNAQKFTYKDTDLYPLERVTCISDDQRNTTSRSWEGAGSTRRGQLTQRTDGDMNCI